MNTSLRVSGASLLIGALIIPVVALAAEIRTGQSTSLAASEVSSGNLYLIGGNVSSAGRVSGDLVAAGGTVVVSGPVFQDIAIGGGNLTIVGDIGGDVRAGGGNILVNGRVGNDVVAAGGSVQISGNGVAGDVLWAGGALQVTAPIGGDMRLAGGEVTINSRVRGNVEFKGNKLVLGKDAVIDGNLDYTAKSEATMEAGAVVRGKTTFEQRKAATTTPAIGVGGIVAILTALVFGKFLWLLVLALALGLIFRRCATDVLGRAVAQPLFETGRGLVVLIVLPVASVLALVSIIGLPLGILGLMTFGLLMIISHAFAAVIAGSVAHKWMFKSAAYSVTWKTILLGAAVVTLLGLIPVAGPIAKCLLVLLTLGSLTKITWDAAQDWR